MEFSRAFLVLAAAATMLATLPAGAVTLIEPRELPALVAESTRALEVRVVEVRHGFDDRRLHSTWVRAEVERRLYGEDVAGPGGTVEFKIYGAPVAMPDGSRLFIDGTARLEVGERYLLLLIGESPWGFTNTAGLAQGAFRITVATDGREMAESLAGTRSVVGDQGLGRWIDPETVDPSQREWLDATRGPLPAALLRQAILSLERAGSGR